MAEGITWSDRMFTGIAYLTPDQPNDSRSFRRTNRATGDPEQWDADDLPTMEIPGDPESTFITSVLDPSAGLISWQFDEATSNAAIAAGRMWWVQSGRRVGKLGVQS